MKYEEAITWVATALEDHLRNLPASAREPVAAHARMAMGTIMESRRQSQNADALAEQDAWGGHEVKPGGTD